MTDETAVANPLADAEEPPVLEEAPNLLRGYAARMLTARLERMLSHTDNVLAEDMEALKQMRVWSRRSRAALDIFGVCFAEKPYQSLALEVKGVTRALGYARDLDVMIKRLEETQNELPEEQRGGIQFGIDGMKALRAQAQPAVIETIAHLKRYDLLNRWKALQVLPETVSPAQKALKNAQKTAKNTPKTAKNAPKTPEIGIKNAPKTLLNAQKSLLENAAIAIKARLNELLSQEDCLRDAKRVLEHHEMRIAAKRLRYTLEIFKEAFDNHCFAPIHAELLQQVRDLQEFLGDIHDADVLIPQLALPLKTLLQKGYPDGLSLELQVGADRVDFNGLAGIIVACQTTQAFRDRRFGDLQARWKTLQESRLFEETIAALEPILQGVNA